MLEHASLVSTAQQPAPDSGRTPLLGLQDLSVLGLVGYPCLKGRILSSKGSKGRRGEWRKEREEEEGGREGRKNGEEKERKKKTQNLPMVVNLTLVVTDFMAQPSLSIHPTPLKDKIS